jgi:adenylate kinase family enzyme
MVKNKKGYDRIYITGSSGAGKNWLAERLSETFGISYYDLDDIAWIKKYTIKRDKKEKAKKVDEISRKKKWIICGAGNTYLGKMPDRSDMIIILRAHAAREMFRVLKRHIKKNMNGESSRLKTLINNFIYNYKDYHRPTGKSYQFLKKLGKKHSKKILILSKKGVGKYLKTLDK